VHGLNQPNQLLSLIYSSYSVGTYISNLLEEKGFSSRTFQIYDTLKNDHEIDVMVDAINICRIVLLTSPLYIYGPPYMTNKLMEMIAEKVSNGEIKSENKIFVATSSAGFVEYYHNDTAISIYEQFSRKVGFKWAGGIPIGYAGLYANISISKRIKQLESIPEISEIYKEMLNLAKVLKNVIHEAVPYLVQGEVVPSKILDKIMYVPECIDKFGEFGNNIWYQRAEQLGTKERIKDKPYEPK